MEVLKPPKSGNRRADTVTSTSYIGNDRRIAYFLDFGDESPSITTVSEGRGGMSIS